MNRITINIDNANIEDVAKLIKEISENIRTSQGAELEELSKKNGWREKLNNLCRFSKNNQKVMLKDIYDMSILLQLLTVLSEKIYDSHNSTLIKVLDDLEELQEDIQEIKDFKSEIKNVLNEEIQKLRDFYSKKVKIQNRNVLEDDNQNLLISILKYIAVQKVSNLQKELSKQDQEYIHAIRLFFGKGAVDVGEFNIAENSIGEIDNREQAKIFYSFILEAIAVIYDEDKEKPLEDALLKNEIFSCIFDELELASKHKKEIEENVRNEIKMFDKVEDHFIRKYESHSDVEDFDFDEQYFDFYEETNDDAYLEESSSCSDIDDNVFFEVDDASISEEHPKNINGKIKMFNELKGFGFILGEDNKDYFFHVSDVKCVDDIQKGMLVDFTAKTGKKGSIATKITAKFVQFGDIKIKVNDIKKYFISSEKECGVYVYRDVSKGGFFSWPRYEKTNEVLGLNDDQWYFCSYKYNSTYERIDTIKHPKGDYLRVYLFDEVKLEHKWFEYCVCIDRQGRIHEDTSILKQRNLRDNLKCTSRDYLDIITYQGDSYRFYFDNVSFNIYEKCEELNNILKLIR